MYATDNNLDLANELQASRPVPTAREVGLSALRFAIHVQRVYEKISIETGPGRNLSEHIRESANAITETIEKISAQRNPAKTGKLYAEVLQQVSKILHWLHQMESSGGIPPKDMQQIRDCGNALSLHLTSVCIEAGSLLPKRQRVSLGESLTDL